MESEHRKIELQSPADLTYLSSCIRTAARQKLDLHLPPVSDTSEPDELRRHVEELVESFVAQVLAGMRHNISINGIDVVARGQDDEGEHMQGIEGEGLAQVEKEEFEPFDDKLRTKLSTTVQKRDALVAKISQHRRTTPAAAAAAWQAQFDKESDALFAEQANVLETAHGVGEGDIASVEAIKRADEVARNWERSLSGLVKLNKGLPETRARLERCGDVVGYLSEKK